MALTALTLQVLQPGQRADALLAAVAAELGEDGVPEVADGGLARLLVALPAGDCYRLAEKALDDAGDEDRAVVCVLRSPG